MFGFAPAELFEITGRRRSPGADRRLEHEQVVTEREPLEQQAANRRRTWLVMAAFIAIFLAHRPGLDIFVIGDGAGVPADRDDRRARDRRRPARGGACSAATAPCSARPTRSPSRIASARRPPTTTGCATASSRTSSRRWPSRPASRRPGRTSFPTTIRTRSRPAADPAHASIAVDRRPAPQRSTAKSFRASSRTRWRTSAISTSA